MKVSYKWLKKYVDTTLSPEKIAEILTDTGLEVEGLEKVEAIKGGLEGVVIGKVLTCVSHPNADRLKITKVDVGEKEPVQIVCGAPNVAAGQKVVVATTGTTLYPNPEEPFKIKKSKIRGEESEGMICAEDELGIGISHEGILVLPDDVKTGMPAAEYFNLGNDYVFEIGLTPNRSDAMGHIGVARDILAYLKVHENHKSDLKLPDLSGFSVHSEDHVVKVRVENNEACPRYMGLTISSLTIKPSPDWLKNSLLTIGITPKNNVVDVTNYVMHELGTPLHAFDLENVDGQVVVRKAKEGEEFTTLDEEKRKLSSEDLMITNGKENMCLAGIFGGSKSGVKDSTKAIFLEAALFESTTIRKTAKHHGLNTDASFRFERGVDPEMIPFALKRAALLILEVAGGKITMTPTDIYPEQIQPSTVDFSYSRCNKLIGKEIPEEIIDRILTALDIEISEKKGDGLRLKIPTYRVDVTREADVIEEVLRIYGFNKIDLPSKWNVSLSEQNLRSEENRQNKIAELLVSQGFFETMNNSLSSSAWTDKFGGDVLASERNVHILNPLSNELNVMRQTLVFQGLQSIAHNQNRQNPDLKLFEFGKVYHVFDKEYKENKRLTLFLSGRKFREQWNSENRHVSFYSLKGHVVNILERLGLNVFCSTKGLKKSLLEDGVQLFVQKHKIGELGWTSKELNRGFGVKQDVFVADLDWDMILSLENRNKVKFTPLPKTFSVRRDFSLLLDKKTSFSDIEDLAFQSDRKILKEVNLFDVYEGDKLPEGKKSYAVSFSFQDEEKTLKDTQIDKLMASIRNALEKELNAELR
ncbi:MAG: phenylalanine--tRNA ligase subunit beta [Brumimicrobium sp.]|nr:phenylalanine--tRNA ligase subunit beta [Brumimicrobium sp.]